MKLIERYIGSTVLFSVAGVLLLIVGLDAVFGFIAELNDLENQYQLPQALVYIAMTLPRRIYEFIPVATLIGCLVGLGTLANTSELTVIRAAGISVARIVWAAVQPVILVVLIGLLLGQFVVPKTEQYAQSERTLLIDGSDTIQARYGFWYVEGNEFFHIKAMQPNGVVFGLARYIFDDSQRLVEAEYAARGIFQGDHWMLEDVRQTLFEMEHTQHSTLDTLRWNTNITPGLLSIVVLKPANLSITDLFTFASYSDEQGLESGTYFFAFWKKVFQPATTLVMVFIAISFIFGPLRSVTVGQRVVTGVVVGLVFTYSQEILGHVSVVYDVPPVLAAGVPVLIFLGVGIHLLRKV